MDINLTNSIAKVYRAFFLKIIVNCIFINRIKYLKSFIALQLLIQPEENSIYHGWLFL